jgi:hypothetical protein
VGRLYIGTVIAGSAWHARVEAGQAAGRPARAQGGAVDPAELADLLWTMHHTAREPEALYPEGIFGPRKTEAGSG